MFDTNNHHPRSRGPDRRPPKVDFRLRVDDQGTIAALWLSAETVNTLWSSAKPVATSVLRAATNLCATIASAAAVAAVARLLK